MSKVLSKYLAEIGAKGGKKSRRQLTPTQARDMVKAREAKRKGRKRNGNSKEGTGNVE